MNIHEYFKEMVVGFCGQSHYCTDPSGFDPTGQGPCL